MSPEEVLRQVGNDAAKAWEALHSGHHWTPTQKEWLRSVVAIGQPKTAAPMQTASARSASSGVTPPSQPAALQPAPVQTPVQAAGAQAGNAQASTPNGFNAAGTGSRAAADATAGMPGLVHPRTSSAPGTAVDYGMPGSVTPQFSAASAPSVASAVNRVPSPGVPTTGDAAKQAKGEHSGRSKGAFWSILAMVLLSVLAVGGLIWVWHNGAGPADTGAAQTQAPSVAASQEPSAAAAGATSAPTDVPDVTPAELRSGTGSYICSSPGVGVQCWGTKLDKQKVPLAPISGLENVSVAVLSVGHGFATAVGTDGTVYTWGANNNGQLGADAGASSDAAVKVGTLPGRPSALVTGNEHSCALVSGEVYCYGSNRFGQVNGTSSKGPVGVTKVEGVEHAVQLGTSGYDAWAITPDGTWAWGNNTWGQVGEGSGGVAAPTFTPAK
ncbi:RCC1 domain-containing protein [Actinomyces trachealis]|uniref:RCC1 domain-containing protein n=1 Tax=Actinomyces trachealis TaxID=2763540 RepID=UPI001892A84E|nr:hypothetical protein [Actinomyces trachealis]